MRMVPTKTDTATISSDTQQQQQQQQEEEIEEREEGKEEVEKEQSYNNTNANDLTEKHVIEEESHMTAYSKITLHDEEDPSFILSSEKDANEEELQYFLLTMLRLSYTCPFRDVRQTFQRFLKSTLVKVIIITIIIIYQILKKRKEKRSYYKK